MDNLRPWKITGILATLVIVLTVPAYLLKERYRPGGIPASQGPDSLEFVGSQKCAECHQPEYQRWKGSHHDQAMDLATEESVLGDFDSAEFDYFGFSSRFYRRAGRFFVHTQGPGGEAGEFEITHTFGWYPLQQYLVPFPGGRLQCLPIAWDARQKRWYHLYPEQPIDPDDWLYWTNAAQNWNGMCAECHSTNLKKNYDPQSDTYATTWSEIDVGCEACHGPGSKHVEWAQLPAMARPQIENDALAVQTAGLASRELVELCAPCHSRRSSLGDYTHAEHDFLDSMLPALLTENLYYPDGQILEEVYVYGSFTQSKMYHREVRCSDCHDVHSAKIVKSGNELCLQCHRGAVYDDRSHHFHKQKGEPGEPIRSKSGEVLYDVGSGAECIQCHMPGRYYMGIDYRPDHSFRLPRPDLSLTSGVPNACNRCHADKSAQWADTTLTQWYGPGRRFHYGSLLAEARKGSPEAVQPLLGLALDPLYPVIVRATALALLPGYGPSSDSLAKITMALGDPEALIRRTAVSSLQHPDPKELVRLLAPLLHDPVKAVRSEAARKLAGPGAEHLSTAQKAPFEDALREYKDAMLYAADFAPSRHNLGNLYSALAQPQQAIRHYEAALAIDHQFYPAKVNLALLAHQQGDITRAERLLREVTTEHAELPEVNYSLALLLAEKQAFEAAAVEMRKAALGMPGRARVHYNLGLLLARLNRGAEAERALKRALALEPANFDFLFALADFYLKHNQSEHAESLADKLIELFPDRKIGHDLKRALRQRHPSP
ncbi:MAG: tetratricopeptide repeat protein [Desulfobacterales bacterium]